MAEIIWTVPALNDLDQIAEYIALDNLPAAKKYVTNVFKTTDRLSKFPNSGKEIREMPDSIYQELVIPPCRLFYRIEKKKIFILHIQRGEKLFRDFLLEERSKKIDK